MAPPAPSARRALPDPRAFRVYRDRKENRVPPVPLAHREQQGRKVTLVFEALPDPRETPAHREPPGRKVLRAFRVFLVRTEPQDRLAPLEKTAPPARRVHPVLLEQQVPQVRLARMRQSTV